MRGDSGAECAPADREIGSPKPIVNVICVKWGTYYPALYVNRLFAMVSRNLHRPFRFVCFTDDHRALDSRIEHFPIPDIQLPTRRNGGWRKLALLAPELGDLRGPALYLDLDVIITADLDCFFEYPGQLCIIENWTQRNQGVGNSSVFRFEVSSLVDIYEQFNSDPEAFARRYPNEQSYLSLVPKNVKVSFWPDAWVKSFKLHCLPFALLRAFRAPHIPRGAHIVVFHGKPKMDEAARGRNLWDSRDDCKVSVPWFWRQAPWVDELWREDACA